MKKRTIEYFKKIQAMKVIQHPLETDLTTFLNATFSLCHNNVVKQDILATLRQLEMPIDNNRRHAA